MRGKLQVKLLPAVLFATLLSCAGGLELPEIPSRDDLPVPSRVDLAYEDLLDDPTNPEFNGTLGIAVHRNNDVIHAESLYRRAFMLEPDEFRWQYYLAHAQFSLDRYDLAVNSYRRALRTNPGYTAARVQLATITYRMGNLVECRQLSQEMLASSEAAAIASFWLGKVAETQRDFAEAMKQYSAACELYPEFGEAHLRLGFTLAALADSAGAREHWIVADRYKFQVPPVEDPLFAEVAGKLHRATDLLADGFDYETKGRYEEAEKQYRAALRIDPRSVSSHARLIYLCARSDRLADSMRHYQRAKQLASDEADTYAAYGYLLLQQERYQEAASTLDQALRLNPYHPEALMRRALLHEKAREYDDAEELYRKAVEGRPGYRDAHLGLGRNLLHAKRYGEAFEQFEAVVAREDERTPELYYELSSLYIMAGNRTKASDCLRMAHELARKYGQAKLMDRIEAPARR